MAISSKFENTRHKVEHILMQLDSANPNWAVPEMQREFVWKNSQVIKLLSSMYAGYPVGAILYWENSSVPSRAIGSEKRNDLGKKYDLVIDGQQRLTSLKVIFEGYHPVRKTKSGPIKIQFNPLANQNDGNARFELIPKNGRVKDGWLDILDVLTETDPKGNRSRRTDAFEILDNYRTQNPGLSQSELSTAQKSITRLLDLYSFEIPAVKLLQTTTHAEAADIFVRINSSGTKLDAADFIMTTLSLDNQDLKDKITRFAKDATESPIFTPEPIDALTSLIAYTFGLPSGSEAYEKLQGKTPQGYDADAKAKCMEALVSSADFVCNDNNWNEFMAAISGAGICSRKYLTSDAALQASYAIYLYMVAKKDVSKEYIQNAIGLWMLFCTLTRRYTSHTDTQTKNDLRAFKDKTSASAIIKEIYAFIDEKLPTVDSYASFYRECEDILTVCSAQQNIHTLFSKVITTRQAITTPAPGNKIEEHHLFPKNYMLKTYMAKGMTRELAEKRVDSEVDVIENLAPIAASENSKIGDNPPAEYVEVGTKPGKDGKMKNQALKAAFTDLEWTEMCDRYALPQEWWKMEFEDFVAQRAKLIPGVIKKSFDSLRTLKS